MFWQRRSVTNPIRTSLVAALLVAGVISSGLALPIQDSQNAEQHRASARRLRAAGEYSAALVHAQQAVALDEQASPPDEDALARSLVLLGQISDALAQFDLAERHHLRARRIVESSSNRNELLKAEVFDGLAAHLVLLGRFQEAEPLVKEALATRERLAGAAHVTVAQSLATLTDLQHERATCRRPRRWPSVLTTLPRRTYSSTSIELGDYTNRVARAQIASGNYPRAEQLYRESLAIREKASGPDSLATAESIGGLARVALLSNDNAASEERHRQSLAIRERVLGPDHPQVANDVFNLGLLSYRRRDYKSAIDLSQRALRIREKAFGRSHPAIAFSLNNLGLVYWRQGNYPRAEEFFERSLALSEQLYGPDSLRIATSLANLGIMAKETGKYAKARVRYRRALAIQEKHLGSQHPALITTVESLGILYRDLAEYDAGRGDVSADAPPDNRFARPAASVRRAASRQPGSVGTGPRANGRRRSRRGSSSWPSRSATCRWNCRPGLNDRRSHSSSRYSMISKKQSRSTFNTHLTMRVRATLRSRRCCSAKAESSTRSPITSGSSGIAPLQRTACCWINWRASHLSSRQRCSASRRTSPPPIASGRSAA